MFDDTPSQTLHCPACASDHDDWDLVDEQTVPTRYGYGRSTELACNRCDDGTVVVET